MNYLATLITCFHLYPLPINTPQDTVIFLDRYATPQHASTEKCTRHYIPKLLSDTPLNITEKFHTHSYSAFSRYIKSFYINQYSENCSIIDCFVCNNYV